MIPALASNSIDANKTFKKSPGRVGSVSADRIKRPCHCGRAGVDYSTVQSTDSSGPRDRVRHETMVAGHNHRGSHNFISPRWVAVARHRLVRKSRARHLAVAVARGDLVRATKSFRMDLPSAAAGGLCECE